MEIFSQNDLIKRLLNVRKQNKKEVVFLVGAPLSTPRILSVAEMIDRLKIRFGSDTVKEGASYQEAFSAVQAHHGLDAANEMVREAVLKACDCTPEERALALAGDEEGCSTLENDSARWYLNAGPAALGELIGIDFRTFGKLILTTNFDPLIKVAINRAGGQSWRTVYHGDSSLGQDHADGCRIIHAHGHWALSDTLHTTEQLEQDRPKLKNSLRRRLEKKVVVVVAYGGWKDIFTESIFELLADDEAKPEVLWTLYTDDAAAIEHQIDDRLAGLRPGLNRGRATIYGGINCHEFFPTLLSAVKGLPVPSPRPISPAVPLPPNSLDAAKAPTSTPADPPPNAIPVSPGSPATPPASDQEDLPRKEISGELRKALFATLPIAVVSFLVASFGSWFRDEPLSAALVALPILVVLLSELLFFLKRDPRLVLRGRALSWSFWIFVGVYGFLAFGSNLLDAAPPTIKGSTDELPRNFLGLSRIEAWHYLVAPDAPEVAGIVVVWIENRGRSIEEVRHDLAGLLKKTRGLVKGLAIDFAPTCPSQFDQVLCKFIKEAPGALFFATKIIQETKELASLAPLSPELQTCIGNDRVGHPALIHDHAGSEGEAPSLDRYDPCGGQLVAGRDQAEVVVTAVPSYFEADPTRPSLSLLAARALGFEGEPPKLLYFLPPQSEVPAIEYAELEKGLKAWNQLNHKFLFVGAGNEEDRWQTPFGPEKIPGVMLHAWATHSILKNHFIVHLGPTSSLPIFLVLSYLLTLALARWHQAPWRMVGRAAVIFAVVCLGAAIAMHYFLLWIDVLPFLLGIILLTLLLLAVGRRDQLLSLASSVRRRR